MRRVPKQKVESLPVQVFVVDDEPPIVRMVVRMLEDEGYRVAGYTSPQAFLKQERPVPPCCLVLDVHMPEVTGPEIQARLTGADDATSVVFMSGLGDVSTSVRAMKAGAIDFLAKPFAREEMLAAVATALKKSAEKVEQRNQMLEARTLLARLTQRERQVYDCVVRGLQSKQIAEELGAAVKTINIHRSRLMTKLGVSGVAELVKLAMRASNPS